MADGGSSTPAPRRIRIRDGVGGREVHAHGHAHGPGHPHHGDGGHGHSHGLVDRSILRSRAGVRAVAQSLGVLAVAAGAQLAVFVLSGSVALLGDLIHNFGDALTAVPLAIAFLLRSFKAERLAGLAVVLVILASACVALAETIDRLVHPQDVTHLWALAGAGAIGWAGNELAARIRLRAGARLASAALVADGKHARADAYVSLGVVASAGLVALGAQEADPAVGLLITLVILKITRDSWRGARAARPDGHEHPYPHPHPH